jgi:cytochrome c oxidase subunit II
VNIPGSIWTMLAGIALTLVSIWYGFNNHLLPAAASAEAPLIDGLFAIMMVIGTALFLIVIGVILVAVFKFRAQPGDTTDGPNIHGNIPLEILWTGIPAILVLGIGVYSFDIYNQIGGLNPMDHSAMAHAKSATQMAQMPGSAMAATLNPASDQSAVGSAASTMAIAPMPDMTQSENSETRMSDPAMATDDLKITALGLQYAWLFTYPDAGITVGELHVPVGRTVDLSINAQDVLHAFWVPEFRLKQDAVPGIETGMRFTPTVVGEYPVICAELCGPYHGIMRTKVIAETPADYAIWIDEQKANASTSSLDRAIAAMDPTRKSPDEFLTPFLEPMGLDPQDLSALQALAH